MNLEEFKASLHTDQPPTSLNPYLKALWYDGKQDWEASHNIAQDIPDSKGSWIHAYLHRKEGDIGNAGYWYNRAKKQMPSYSLDKEWEEIVVSFL